MDDINPNKTIDPVKAEKAKQEFLKTKNFMIEDLQEMITILKKNDEPIKGEDRKELFRLMRSISESGMARLDNLSFNYFDAITPVTDEMMKEIRKEMKQGKIN
jgi:hypothetical protein